MKPYLVKDHNYELPIKSIKFQEKEDIVLSMDKRIVKMWDRKTVSNTLLVSGYMKKLGTAVFGIYPILHPQKS